MKVFLDDCRPAPPGWVLARTIAEAQRLVLTGEVTHLSLDYNLGPEDAGLTGYDFVLWLAETGRWPSEALEIHSSDPWGRRRMKEAIRQLAPVDYAL